MTDKPKERSRAQKIADVQPKVCQFQSVEDGFELRDLAGNCVQSYPRGPTGAEQAHAWQCAAEWGYEQAIEQHVALTADRDGLHDALGSLIAAYGRGAPNSEQLRALKGGLAALAPLAGDAK